MIVKSISIKKPDFRRLLNYVTHNKNRLFDPKGRSFAITHNMKGNSIGQWEKQFKENEKLRLRKRKDSVIITHEILSWHVDDTKNINVDKMQDMAREYIKLRNPNGMFVAVPHFDKDHFHIHIVASGVGYRTGRSLRMSKAEFAKLKKDIQKYQLEKYPELSNSIVDHGRKNRGRKANTTEKEFQLKRRTRNQTKKEKVADLVESCLKQADSRKDFYSKLEAQGMKTYIRGGKVSGIVKDRVKHRFKRLGIGDEKIALLDRGIERETEIHKTRRKERAWKRERSR